MLLNCGVGEDSWSRPRDGTWVSCISGGFFTSDPSEEGEEVGDGKAEWLAAIGDGGRAAVSLMPDADGSGPDTLLESDACSHLWKFATWQFACRGFTILAVSSGLRGKTQGPLHWNVQPFSEWRLGFNTQEVYAAFPLVLEGLENGNIITSSVFYGSEQSENPFRFKERWHRLSTASYKAQPAITKQQILASDGGILVGLEIPACPAWTPSNLNHLILTLRLP